MSEAAIFFGVRPLQFMALVERKRAPIHIGWSKNGRRLWSVDELRRYADRRYYERER